MDSLKLPPKPKWMITKVQSPPMSSMDAMLFTNKIKYTMN